MNGSTEVKSTQILIVKGVIMLNALIALLTYFLTDLGRPFVVGMLFGTIIAILNFRLLYITLNKALNMSDSKAKFYAASRYLIRYALTGIVIYISIIRPHIHVLGTIIGLITIKFVIIKKGLFNNKQYFKNIFQRKEE
ncbi:ATP synthase subunit I [Serpentinicella sp. ANB-PHB4]|uniref:ATP synthase subunit I n=1 Tax=Serpentinicella sp. ANB-PHB4 TaxID=3074076 RepID=UPI002861C4CD|nr:ATP synthase subunit I [Serpentinicella sp. ANB-PHB4]MDR5659719.1 ATP synthase subunit I [Serpentinicella sp. ANB-PHB4]